LKLGGVFVTTVLALGLLTLAALGWGDQLISATTPALAAVDILGRS